MSDMNNYDHELEKVRKIQEEYKEIDMDHHLSVDIAALIGRMSLEDKVRMKVTAMGILADRE